MTDDLANKKPAALDDPPTSAAPAQSKTVVVPPEAEQALRQFMAITAASYQGPIPSAKELAAYKQVRPELPERIMAMAEREQGNRHRNDLLAIVLQFCGMGCGLAVAIYGLWVALNVALSGSAWAGALLAAADLAGLVSVFVLGSRVRRKQAKRDEEAAEPS